ncbi:c-type cytochrome [Bowmanella pacifica]|uniref:Mono-heme cytochrome C n=1 Tax=Bowmanella pacifica TaxID=502051 RepID=A0A917YSJ0_9ALTE|nr:c-type cytochrome [Bowmanella pacifica]GGO65036.1 mono-heme cytochrome C [Bowmanella pacifica]
MTSHLRPLALILTSLSVSTAQAQMTPEQMQLLGHNCLQCHAAANTGAPLLGDIQDWQARMQKGREQILKNSIEGIGGMPPMGYCSACTQEDMQVLIDFMLGDAKEVGHDN